MFCVVSVEAPGAARTRWAGDRLAGPTPRGPEEGVVPGKGGRAGAGEPHLDSNPLGGPEIVCPHRSRPEKMAGRSQ